MRFDLIGWIGQKEKSMGKRVATSVSKGDDLEVEAKEAKFHLRQTYLKLVRRTSQNATR